MRMDFRTRSLVTLAAARFLRGETRQGEETLRVLRADCDGPASALADRIAAAAGGEPVVLVRLARELGMNVVGFCRARGLAAVQDLDWPKIVQWEAAVIETGDCDAIWLFAEMDWRAGRWERAVPKLRLLCTMAPKNFARLGECLSRLGRMSEALDAHGEALRRHGGAPVHCEIAFDHFAEGDTAKAVEVMCQCLAGIAAPDWATARSAILIFYAAGRPDLADEVLDAARPHIHGAAMDGLDACRKLAAGDADAALLLTKSAALQGEQGAFHHCIRGLGMEAAGRFAEAMDCYSQAMETYCKGVARRPMDIVPMMLAWKACEEWGGDGLAEWAESTIALWSGKIAVLTLWRRVMRAPFEAGNGKS